MKFWKHPSEIYEPGAARISFESLIRDLWLEGPSIPNYHFLDVLELALKNYFDIG